LTSDRNNHGIKHALETIKTVEQNNYVKFFRLYKSTPNMGSHILDFIKDKIRLIALKTITFVYRPTVATQYISSLLGFENETHCIKYLKERNFVFMQPLNNMKPKSSLILTEIDCKVSYSELLNWEKLEEDKLKK